MLLLVIITTEKSRDSSISLLRGRGEGLTFLRGERGELYAGGKKPKHAPADEGRNGKRGFYIPSGKKKEIALALEGGKGVEKELYKKKREKGERSFQKAHKKERVRPLPQGDKKWGIIAMKSRKGVSG